MSGRRLPAGLRDLAVAIALASFACMPAGCMERPVFHCKSSSACIADDGSRGTCSNGVCVFGSDHVPVVTTGDGAPADAGCSADPLERCYACTPKTSVQLVNACTSSMCVPFDDAARLSHLPQSGVLPPLPQDAPR